MKKFFLLMVAAMAMTFVSCDNNAKGSGDNDSTASEEGAALTEFTVLGGFNSTTGSNYKAFDYGKTTGFKFELAGEGEELDVTATCKLIRSEEPAKSIDGNTEVWMSYYAENAEGKNEKVAEIQFVSTPESQEKIAECIEKGKPGDEVEFVGKAKVKKADLMKMNGQKTNNALICR